MKMTLWFDMDGTIANLYAIEGWLDYLIAQNPTPYIEAKPMLNLSLFARLLHHAQTMGYRIGIISWLAKNGSPEYNAQVALEKMWWLHRHLPSVQWDEIRVVAYGTNKWEVCREGILFDDEEGNREAWQGIAYTPNNIIPVLKGLLKGE